MPDPHIERAGEEAERERLLSGVNAEMGRLPMPRLRLGVNSLPFFTDAKPQEVALFLMMIRPDLSIDEIATIVDVARSTLYRDKKIRVLLRARRSDKARLPRGSKDRDGNIEAWRA